MGIIIVLYLFRTILDFVGTKTTGNIIIDLFQWKRKQINNFNFNIGCNSYKIIRYFLI